MTKPWQEVIDFWKQAGSGKWFEKDDNFDTEIINKYHDLYEKAASGQLDDWMRDPDGCLALILILDQFSRNMFRGDPKTFASDPKALELAKYAIEQDFMDKVDPQLAFFIPMPFMHSENLEDQKVSLEIQIRLDNEFHARQHLEIIERFGRFPHRNKVLGRISTPEEIAYLESGGFKG